MILFLVVTFALTWSAWGVAMTVIDSRRAAPAVLQLIILPGVVAPALVALWLTWRQGGTAGVRVLAERLTHWQVPVRWYGFALGFMMAVKLAAAGMHRFATGAWPSFAAPGLVPLMILGAVLSTPFQAGEEIGWRGYALPRLAARFGARLASLLLGIIWALWHLLFFYMAGTPYYTQSVGLYTLQVTALSVAMSWLYFRTGGSLLLVMLMHAAVNNTKDIVPSGSAPPVALSGSLVAWLTMATLWLVAAYCLARMTLPAIERTPEQGAHVL